MPPTEFFEDEKRTLILRHTAGTAAPTDADMLAAEAAVAGYGDLALDARALAAAAGRIGKGESFSLAVGRRADAEYQVVIAADQMSATLTVIEAQGGVAADVGGAAEALGARGIVYGLDEKALAAALAAPGTAVTVARGEAALASADGRLETLINLGQIHRPQEDDKGRADFRELGLIHSVAVGTPLLRRHPPQPGRPGRTVLGAEIPAAKPKDVKFPAHLDGVAAAPGKPDLLIAEVAGHPVVRRDCVRVDPILVLPEVDLASGNIDFIGAVEIKGDVQTGMKIKAGGSVVIHGTLESAEVDAGGDVEVKGGVIGQRDQGSGDGKPSGARVRAKGSVRAHHVENASIFAEQSVFVSDLIAQSEVTALEEVVVGKEGGRRGHIMGGVIRATRAVTAYCLGASGSSRTEIVVGLNPPLAAAIEASKAAAAAKRKEQDDLEKLVRVLQARTDRAELLAKAQFTLERARGELADIQATLAEQEAELKLTDKAEVVVVNAVHPGVAVTIGRKVKVVAENLGAGTFRLAVDAASEREEEVVAFQR